MLSITVGCTIMLGITIVIPICMVVIGGLYLYDCPQGEYIPVYLLVGGGFGVFKQLLDLSARVRQGQVERDEERIRQSPTQTLITCFIFGWFIIGQHHNQYFNRIFVFKHRRIRKYREFALIQTFSGSRIMTQLLGNIVTKRYTCSPSG